MWECSEKIYILYYIILNKSIDYNISTLKLLNYIDLSVTKNKIYYLYNNII